MAGTGLPQHIFVAALALLLRCLLERRLKAAKVDLSAKSALEAVETVRQVTFNIDGECKSGVSAASGRAHQVLKALKIQKLRGFFLPQIRMGGGGFP